MNLDELQKEWDALMTHGNPMDVAHFAYLHMTTLIKIAKAAERAADQLDALLKRGEG